MIYIISFIGKLLANIENLRLRFVNYYKLCSLGKHGVNCHIEGGVNIAYRNIYLGDNVFIPSGATFLSSNAKILIGDNVMFGPNVTIVTGNHRFDVVGTYMVDVKEKRENDDEDVVVGNDVWIGMNTIILKGVHIGEGSVIGAGTIVTKSVPPYSIVTNKVVMNIRQRFTQEQIEQHRRKLNIR